jgi:hypothetical protein
VAALLLCFVSGNDFSRAERGFVLRGVLAPASPVRGQ